MRTKQERAGRARGHAAPERWAQDSQRVRRAGHYQPAPGRCLRLCCPLRTGTITSTPPATGSARVGGWHQLAARSTPKPTRTQRRTPNHQQHPAQPPSTTSRQHRRKRPATSSMVWRLAPDRRAMHRRNLSAFSEFLALGGYHRSGRIGTYCNPLHPVGTGAAHRDKGGAKFESPSATPSAKSAFYRWQHIGTYRNTLAPIATDVSPRIPPLMMKPAPDNESVQFCSLQRGAICLKNGCLAYNLGCGKDMAHNLRHVVA
jgi:hypothetical protein